MSFSRKSLTHKIRVHELEFHYVELHEMELSEVEKHEKELSWGRNFEKKFFAKKIWVHERKMSLIGFDIKFRILDFQYRKHST